MRTTSAEQFQDLSIAGWQSNITDQADRLAAGDNRCVESAGTADEHRLHLRQDYRAKPTAPRSRRGLRCWRPLRMQD
jgi:hypothetical protein